MIYIKLNDDNFEYDIYSLVKAFCPREEIAFVKIRPEDKLSYFLVINYIEDAIELELYKSASDVATTKDSIEVDHSDRKETKNRLKRLIYYAFSKETGKEFCS